MQALVRRWHVEKLLALDNQPNRVRLDMPRRSAIMLEILIDRRGWPATMRGVRSQADC
jgi:hypothetical protein